MVNQHWWTTSFIKQFSIKLTEDRANKITNEQAKDIHERDKSHIVDSYQAACDLVNEYNWEEIQCVKDEKIRTIEDIHEEIYKIVKSQITV